MTWHERDQEWVNELTMLYDKLYYQRTVQTEPGVQQGVAIAMVELVETFPWLIKEWMERVRTS